MKIALPLYRRRYWLLWGLGLTGCILNIGVAACLQTLVLAQGQDTSGHAAYYFTRECAGTLPAARQTKSTPTDPITTDNWAYNECVLLTDLAPYCHHYLIQQEKRSAR